MVRQVDGDTGGGREVLELALQVDSDEAVSQNLQVVALVGVSGNTRIQGEALDPGLLTLAVEDVDLIGSQVPLPLGESDDVQDGSDLVVSGSDQLHGPDVFEVDEGVAG